MPYTYPPARKDDIVDDFHGTPVPDPYRWLENMEAPETRAWLEAQAALTTPFLQALPSREAIKTRLTELWDFPKYSPPVRRGKHYFYFKNDGLQNQSVLYRQEGLNGAPQVVIDPNTFSTDGTVALVNIAFSEDGHYLAYGRSSGGSDLQEVFIHDVRAGKDLSEVIRWGRFVGIAWKHDTSGFYYNRYPEPGSVPPEESYFYNRVYFHRLNTPQSDDILVYERPDAKELGFFPSVSEDGQTVWLSVWSGASSKNRLYYRPVASDSDFTRLIDDPSAMHNPIGDDGDVVYIHTDKDTPRGRIVAIDVNQPTEWKDIVPESAEVIAFAAMVHHQIVVAYLRDAYHRLVIYNLDGSPAGEIPLPAMGSVSAIAGRLTDDEVFISFESFLYPPSILRYDFTTGALSPFGDIKASWKPEDYETHQIFCTSKDRARVPVFLTHKKGLKHDGQNPALLTAYGGFGVSNTPFFDVGNFYWVEQGGVLALAILRGGGEYGEEWHEAGMLANRQNAFDDFIAAAQALVEQAYTSPKKLAIHGASNGGLLVSACMLQRPDLYGAVLCGVPVADMLRFHKFTAGRFWTAEYGNAETSAEHFRFLYAYSPLHNVKPGVTYPPIIIMTAEGDDRVVPLHSMKLTAALQAVSPGVNPVLLRFEFKAGHGFGKPTSKIIAEISDIFAFAYQSFQQR